jgi:hypothetical protein
VHSIWSSRRLAANRTAFIVRSLLEARSLERRYAVAALALTAKLPKVNVILHVAGRAIAGELDLVGRLPVTTLAGRTCVGSQQRKTGDLLMVEFPDSPTARRMTRFAILAQRPSMAIITLVTIETLCLCVLV